MWHEVTRYLLRPKPAGGLYISWETCLWKITVRPTGLGEHFNDLWNLWQGTKTILRPTFWAISGLPWSRKGRRGIRRPLNFWTVVSSSDLLASNKKDPRFSCKCEHKKEFMKKHSKNNQGTNHFNHKTFPISFTKDRPLQRDSRVWMPFFSLGHMWYWVKLENMMPSLNRRFESSSDQTNKPQQFSHKWCSVNLRHMYFYAKPTSCWRSSTMIELNDKCWK